MNINMNIGDRSLVLKLVELRWILLTIPWRKSFRRVLRYTQDKTYLETYKGFSLQLARMELFTATLPVSLQVCAGTRLVEAGLHSAKVVMDIGTCSANSIFNIMTSNVQIMRGTL